MTKNIKTIIYVIIALIIIYVGYTLLKSPAEPQEPETIKIGAILPLSGNAAIYGEYIKKSFDIATEKINNSGGINGKNIEVLYEDSKNDTKEAVSIFHKLQATENIPVFVSVASGPSMALAPLSDKAQKVLFATITAVPGIADTSQWVFRSHPTSIMQAGVMAKFASEDLMLKEVAILYINDEYGQGSLNVFKNNFENAGGSITMAEAYAKDAFDFKTQITKIKNASPDAIWVTGYGTSFPALIKQIKELYPEALILSDLSLSTPAVINQLGKLIEGDYVVITSFDPQDEKIAYFVNDFRNKYNDDPTFFSAIGYDIASMLYKAIEENGFDAISIKRGLLKIQNFQGVMGTTSIKINGEVDFPVTVRQIRNGQFVKYEE